MSQSPPDRRQPIFNVPRVVLAAILVMAAIHGARLLLSDRADATLLARFAFVPGRITASIAPQAVGDRLAALALADGPDGSQAEAGRFFLESGSAQPWTALTYALLHGSWTHFGLNAVWLLAFGAPAARRIGAGRFVVLLAASALAGAVAHYAVDPFSLQPLIGASAAVSGCMGAALRFMFGSPVPGDAEPTLPHRAPRQSIIAMLRNRRSGAFLLVWMISNFVTGAAAVPLGLSDMPIAWQAHVGGFLFGLLAFPLFDPVAARGSPGPDDAAGPEGPGTLEA